MRNTTVSLQRPAGTTIKSGISVQVDQVSLYLQVQLRQANMYQSGDIFKVYTLDWNPTALLQDGDYLVDEQALDPDTGTGANPAQKFIYKVIGRPKDFTFDHQECYCLVDRGN